MEQRMNAFLTWSCWFHDKVFKIASKLLIYNVVRGALLWKTTFSKASSVTDESMGKWKSLIVACLGLGVATGVGFYIYRSISSEENSYEAMKVMAKELF